MLRGPRYHPGPEFELVEDNNGVAVDTDAAAWLLQFPHYWDTSVATELRMQPTGKGGTESGTCIDDEGAQYAVCTHLEDEHKPTYAVFPDSSDVLRPIKRRATVIRSEDVVALFSTAPKKPLTSPIKLKSVAAGPETEQVVQPDNNQLKPPQASPLVSPTDTPQKKEKRHKKRKDQEANDNLPNAPQATAVMSEKKKKRKKEKKDKDGRRKSEP